MFRHSFLVCISYPDAFMLLCVMHPGVILGLRGSMLNGMTNVDTITSNIFSFRCLCEAANFVSQHVERGPFVGISLPAVVNNCIPAKGRGSEGGGERKLARVRWGRGGMDEGHHKSCIHVCACPPCSTAVKAYTWQ